MNKEKTILIDFWETIAESKERNTLWKKVLESFENSGINKPNFFKYWKENWFKSNIEEGRFIQQLRENFGISNYETNMLRDILDYKNLTLINGRLDSLKKLRNVNYGFHLVSDCGRDVKEFVEKTDLNKILSKRFYSFEYGTTKEEDLYRIVSEEIGIDCLMVGDDLKRDYKIPKRYGFRASLVKKSDRLEDALWNS